MKKITIAISQQQLDALKEIVGMGSEDASLSHASGGMDDDSYEEFVKEVETPAIALLQQIQRTFEIA